MPRLVRIRAAWLAALRFPQTVIQRPPDSGVVHIIEGHHTQSVRRVAVVRRALSALLKARSSAPSEKDMPHRVHSDTGIQADLPAGTGHAWHCDEYCRLHCRRPG